MLTLAACGDSTDGSGADAGPGAPDAAAALEDAAAPELDASTSADGGVGDGLDPDLEAELAAALEVGLEDSGSDSVIGAVDIAGQGRWVGTTGPDGLTRGSLVRIGSMTKPFVATITLQLVSEGALSLDDTLDAWFPDVANAESITIRELLRHTSGVFDYTQSGPFLTAFHDDPLREISIDDVLAAIADGAPTFAPGEGWSYSNSGYYIMGSILEAVSGRPLVDLLHDRILGPLELGATFYEPGEPIDGELATGWSSFFTGFWESAGDAYSATVAGPAGGLVSDADDVLDFFGALGSGALLDGDRQDEMFESVEAFEGVRYGFGVMIFDFPGHDAWGHGGTIWGYNTGLVRFEDLGITVFVATNRDRAEPDLVLFPLLEALDLL